MGNKDFLLELGCEEIPARFVGMGVEQLKENIQKWLIANRIRFLEIKAYATPRRLAVVVTGVSERQEDEKELVRGPALRIAKAADGSWSRAAEGFVGKLGITVDQLQMTEIKNETYVIAPIYQIGRKTIDVMQETLYTVFENIQFPKMMRCNQGIRFIRPIGWLVCLLGATVIPIEWAGQKAHKWTYGHRFLGGKAVIPAAEAYVETLREEYVIVNHHERKARIKDQIMELAEQKGWVIPIDEGLLEEVTHLVEYPTVLSGNYREEFLVLPRDVLVTSMREHQRYFPVLNEKGSLLPFFVTVRNGDDRNLATIAKGNEKVLRARLSDARFFYEDDLKVSIEQANKKLTKIVFIKNMGSIADKVERIRRIVRIIGQKTKMDENAAAVLNRAAEISKFSLATQLVSEFPELEGVMAREYAIHAKELVDVADAVHEYHLPRSAKDELPQSSAGIILSLVDKMDTIVCSFGAGIKPTSSQDPYGLRRKANGIVKILIEQQVLSLLYLMQLTVDEMPTVSVFRSDLEKDVREFFGSRIRTMLQEESIRHDIIDAVLFAEIDEPYWIMKKAAVLMSQIETEGCKQEMEALCRVSTLAAKAIDVPLDRELLTESSEHALLRVFEEAKTKYEIAQENNDSYAMYRAIAHMVPEINQFFDRVMVMVEDEKIRGNRLALLKEITHFIHQFSAFEKIIFP